MPAWERQQQRDLDESSKRMQDDFARQREQIRKANNIAEAAENTLLAAYNTVVELIREISAFGSDIQVNEEARVCIVGDQQVFLSFP